MSKKNKKKNEMYNYQPRYINNLDYSYYYEQQYPQHPNNFDVYNYYTQGRYAKNYRHNNHMDYQSGPFINQDFGYSIYNNANTINRAYNNAYTNKHYSRTNNKNSITYHIQDNKQAEKPNKRYRQKEKKEYKKAEHSQVQSPNDKLSDANPELGLLTNVNCGNFNDSSCSTFITESSAEAQKPAEIDLSRPSTRIITKKILAENTEVLEKFKKSKKSTPRYINFWVREKDGDSDSYDEVEETNKVYQIETMKRKKNQSRKQPAQSEPLMRANRFEQKVNKMLCTPVEISKGRSILEKMGWKGGGLGKDGDGIVEPITPKVTYATTTMGLGQLTKEEERAPVLIDRKYLNTLTNILDFVKNYLERELRFDRKFSKKQRKRIHYTVENIRKRTDGFLPYPYSEIVKEIHSHNDYVLVTQSDGKRYKRQLTLYKKARDHMFLISPEDFEEKEETTDVKEIEVKNSTTLKNECITVIEPAQIEDNKEHSQEDEVKNNIENENIDEDVISKDSSSEIVEENDEKYRENITQENNAIVKDHKENKSIDNIENKKDIEDNENDEQEKSNANIKENKEEPKEVEDLLDMIIDYLFDFCEDPLFTEFRFLGPFDYKERCAIDKFFDVCNKKCEIERSKEVLDLFNSDDFYLELRLDNNQRYVIHKIEKNQQQTEIVPYTNQYNNK